MATYNQKDVRIKVNSADLFCNSATIKYDASLTPRYDLSSKNANEYFAGKATVGKLDIVYFLTGSDPLVNNMINERTPISLDFNGLSINSGYLTSYSFDASPFGSLEIKASFDFYEKINGTFAASTSPLTDISPLNASDMTLDNGTVVKEENIKSINYSYQATIAPSYVIEENFDTAGANIAGVTSKDKKISAGFALFDYDLSLPVTGQKEVFNFNFKNKNGESLQTYSVNGFINNKSMGAKIQDNVSSDYSIVQANLGGGDPVISYVNPTSATVGSNITVSGTNFLNVEKVYLGEFPLQIVSTDGTSGIVVKASSDVFAGYTAPIRIITHGGEHDSRPTTVASIGGISSF